MNTILMEKKNCLKMYCNNKVLLKTYKPFFSLLFIIFTESSFSQEERLNDDNSTGWFAYTDELIVSRFGNVESL